jgi:hypothetical protein
MVHELTSMQEGERQILVLRLQGIICVNDLPPVKINRQVIIPICEKNNIRCLLIRCRFATAESRLDIQQVRLTGLGVEEFKDASTAVTKIWQFLSRHIGQISINQTSTFFENYPAITISNRYLTPNSSSTGYKVLPIPPEIDPNGILKKKAGQRYAYTEDNVVAYYQRECSQSGYK